MNHTKIILIFCLCILPILFFFLYTQWISSPSKQESFENPSYPENIVLSDLSLIENIKDTTTSHVVVLLVFDDQCPHCRNFKPTWNSLIKKYNGQVSNNKTFHFYQAGNENVNVRTVIENKYNIQGYPTILISNNQESFKEYTNLRDFTTISSYLDHL